MTAAYAVPVMRCDQSTLYVCTIYLVGGFDQDKNFYPALTDFRHPSKETRESAYLADNGEVLFLRYFAAVVRCRLAKGVMDYQGRRYKFCVDVFDKKH